ncbi:MAG: fibronectin type III domain-containing protein [Nitrospirota bacterium]|nr:fibronectin type III domain-containing protein [Nitrospirota bacterium]
MLSLALWMPIAAVSLLDPSALFAFSYAPSTLTFTATSGGPTPPAQSVRFSKRTLVARHWTVTETSPWLAVSPASGTISREQDTITMQVNQLGLSAGTYTSTVQIAIADRYGRFETESVTVSFIVSGGGTTASPSILLNPASLSFSGTAGGANPLARTMNLLNPTGGTLTWSMTESAAWLALNTSAGTTTTETDQVSASVNIQGLTAGTYSTVIAVTASGATNSPQQIPVSLTLSQPTSTTGSVGLSWTANTEPDLAGYKVYIGTQSQLYNPPITLGSVAAYNASNLTVGRTYYFCVSAFDNVGNESACSTEVSKPLL